MNLHQICVINTLPAPTALVGEMPHFWKCYPTEHKSCAAMSEDPKAPAVESAIPVYIQVHQAS